MTNVIVLHGHPDEDEYYDPAIPSASNFHWIPWLQKQCLINDLPCATPEIPWAFNANYEVWKKEFERFDLSPETIVVTHSCGGGFLIRYLSENKDVQLKKWIAVAPYLDPENEMRTKYSSDLFEFEIDETLIDRVEEIVVFNSDNDMEVIKQTCDQIIELWPDLKIKQFNNYGHFCLEDMGTQEFPELLEEILA